MTENIQTRTTDNVAPIDDARQGTVRIPIWQNEGANGPYFIAGQPENAYLKDEHWLPAKTYSEFDLECLALAALEARKKIRQLRKQLKTDGIESDE